MMSDHTAYVFDAYGTLFDVHAAVRRYADRAGPDGQRLSEIWRAKQLEYTWVCSLMGVYEDFEKLTAEALDYAFARVPSVDRRLRGDLIAAYRTLDCFPEVPRVLKSLKESGRRVAILSNGTPAMLEAAVEGAALGSVIDDLFSADDIGIYKTASATYRMVTDAYGIAPETVSFQSSNRWDVAGAAKFGFRTVWINRTDAPDEYGEFGPSVTLPSLDGLISSSF
ncbi:MULTISPECIES: haloacid dehalogenase type II [unclassified Sinorhizobium]|uniref:haloacid dehalogenase type II n=1 Tax=unclassified Sinorhizobium TaxID=2613772 RepID=UPI0035264B0E